MENLKVACFWFFGVILTFICTALPILLVLIVKVYGIQPEDLSGLIGACFFGSLIVALLPALVIGFAGDKKDPLAECGERMFFRGNSIAWAVWLVLGCVALLFAFAFKEELIDSPDEQDELPPVPLYRRAWKWAVDTALAALIIVLPNEKEGEVPD